MSFARQTYREIASLYSPDRAPCPVDLSDNTNLYGIPPAAERALREAPAAAVTRYPALYAQALKGALAAYAGVEVSQVVTGCGSDDVLDSALRAFADPGERLAFPDPTFVMMPLFAKMNGLLAMPVPLRPDQELDVDGLLATRAKIIYLCSPNNPTGNASPRAAVERLLAEAPGVVILDEAYGEYAREVFLSEAPRRKNLLVVRTLSKAFGLAGMRVGYAVGAPELVLEVEKSRGPYKVTAVAERMGVAALTEDLPWVRARVADVLESRDRFVAELTARGLRPLPSDANFVLVPVPGAAEVGQRMRQRGVAVRPFPALRGVGDALRISIGPWPMMEAALAALKEALR